jgi:hypothetical protein
MMAILYLLFGLSEMPGSGLRYLIFPPLILVLLLLTGARFAQHAYGLNTLRSGFNLLMARMFGVSLPTLIVNDGKIHVDVMGEEDLLYSVGGPGYLYVMPGSVALLESLDGKLRVAGPGRHYVSEIESIKETMSLGEMNGTIEKTSAVTRDGMEITARDIAYRYRLYTGNESEPTSISYSSSDEGMIQMVYSRSMSANGIGDWHGAVKGTVEGFIQDFIRKNIVDYLTAPAAGVEDPRGELQQQFKSQSGKSRFREKGAELVWVDVGHFEVPGAVAEQRVDMWQSGWSGNADLMRAMGEAERMKYQEMGRNEGQAELIRGFLEIMNETRSDGDDRKHRWNVFLAEVLRLIDTWSTSQLTLPPEVQKEGRKDEPK